MTVEARITPIWKKQKLLLGLLMLGFGAWFLFDGLIGYPNNNDRFRRFESVSKDKNDWKKLAEELKIGKVPEKYFEPLDITFQFVFSGVTGLVGLGILAYWFSQLKRTVRMDDDAITTAAGVRVPFSAITGVGKKLWDKKGIAKVRYSLDGKEGEFVVDDYKFDTKPSRQILEEIERRLIESHTK